MIEQLDRVRNIVKSLGWLDEGSLEQAKSIGDDLAPAFVDLLRAITVKFPEEF